MSFITNQRSCNPCRNWGRVAGISRDIWRNHVVADAKPCAHLSNLELNKIANNLCSLWSFRDMLSQNWSWTQWFGWHPILQQTWEQFATSIALNHPQNYQFRRGKLITARAIPAVVGRVGFFQLGTDREKTHRAPRDFKGYYPWAFDHVGDRCRDTTGVMGILGPTLNHGDLADQHGLWFSMI